MPKNLPINRSVERATLIEKLVAEVGVQKYQNTKVTAIKKSITT
jgi:hypothetical protein